MGKAAPGFDLKVSDTNLFWFGFNAHIMQISPKEWIDYKDLNYG